MMSFTPSADSLSRCWAEIDLAALRSNLEVCRDFAGGSCGIIAIVKADAYGHGLEEVVCALADRVQWFGVANLREALRAKAAAGESTPRLLLLGPATPNEIEPIVANGFSASISLSAEVAAFARAAAHFGVKAHLHAIVDTGMGRIGCAPQALAGLVEEIQENPHCHLEGIATHFPSADEDADFTRTQIEGFQSLLGQLNPGAACKIHLANSAGLIGYHTNTPFATLSRPGLALYGVSPLPDAQAKLKPVMSLKTRVSLVRRVPAGTSISYGRTFTSKHPMEVATLAVGYGDGYPRHLSGNRADVLIAGTRCPLLGRVTMDQIVVDVTHLAPSVKSGDEVVLIGSQGDEQITAAEIAKKAGTIPWEIFTGITARVDRVYL